MSLGQPFPVSRSGTSTTVRRLAVTSSPTRPFPRVAPTTRSPFSYVRLTAAPSIFTSSVWPAVRTSGTSRALRFSHSASSASLNALASDSIGTRWRCFLHADALRGAVGGAQLGMLGLELLQFAEQAVVLGVGHLRLVEYVIGVVGALDEPPHLDGSGGRTLHRPLASS